MRRVMSAEQRPSEEWTLPRYTKSSMVSMAWPLTVMLSVIVVSPRNCGLVFCQETLSPVSEVGLMLDWLEKHPAKDVHWH